MRYTCLFGLGLALPLPAQAPLLQPTPASGLVLRLDLQTVPAPSTETGLAALLAVPGMRGMLTAAVGRTCDALAELATLQGIRMPSTLELPMRHCRDLPLQSLTWAMRRPTQPDLALIAELGPDSAAVAARVFDAVCADGERRGVAMQTDASWFDGRRLVAGDVWFGARGNQLVLGSGEPMVAPGPAVTSGGGVQLRARFLHEVLSRHAEPDAAWLAALGFHSTPQEQADLSLDARGYHERLAWVGPREPMPSPRPLTAAPALPRLDGQFLMLRANLDPSLAVGLLVALADRFLPSTEAAWLARCLQHSDGTFAFSVAAPATGRFYPRLALATRISDGEALLAELQQRAAATPEGPLALETTAEGWLATWRVPGAPAALRPALRLVDGMLVLSECPATLRQVVAELGQGDDVFADAGATPCAAPPGTTVLGEIWFDCEIIYQRATKVWAGPLALALQPDVDSPLRQVEAILDPRDLPEAEDVARTLGRGRAVLYLGREEAGLAVAAPTLGPVQSGALAVATGLVPRAMAMGLEALARPARVQAAEARAHRLGEALQRYRQDHGDALPEDVGELVALLPPGDTEPLLAPHDPAALPRPVTRPDGSRGEQRSSFQRAPVGMQASPHLRGMPGTTWLPLLRARQQPPRPVFAFCGAGYRDHHMLILADGDVIWIRSTTLLDALPGKR